MTEKKRPVDNKKDEEDLTDEDVDRAATERLGSDGDGLILED